MSRRQPLRRELNLSPRDAGDEKVLRFHANEEDIVKAISREVGLRVQRSCRDCGQERGE